MSNSIQVLKQSELCGRQFTVYGTPENPLFRAKDVAEIIEHPNVSVMMSMVDDDEKGVKQLLTPGGNQQVWMLTEYGLYEVLMQSRKPIAKQFKKGVKLILHEVRTTGSYSTRSSAPTPAPQPEGIVFWHDGVRVVSSRTLAVMCGREHSDMMKSIRNAYRLLDRPRRSFIEICEKGKCKEILVTVKGFGALRKTCVSMPSGVAAEVSAAFTRIRRGVPTALPLKVPAPPVPSVPSMPSDPSELLARFTKAMAVMLGVNLDNLSGLMQKGGEL